MFRFKFKARPKSRRPRFGGSGSPSKRTRGGSMNRLRKKTDKGSEEDEKPTQSLSRGAGAAGRLARSVGKEITDSAMKAVNKAKNLEEGYDEDGLVEGQGGYSLPARKIFKSKEEQTKAEKEAEDNVNRRRAAEEKANKNNKRTFFMRKEGINVRK